MHPNTGGQRPEWLLPFGFNSPLEMPPLPPTMAQNQTQIKFQLSIGDAIDRALEALSGIEVGFNSPLEMPRKHACQHPRRLACRFQFSIGDAGGEHARRASGWHEFQLSIGDAAAHLRVDYFIAKYLFQFSIGDAATSIWRSRCWIMSSFNSPLKMRGTILNVTYNVYFHTGFNSPLEMHAPSSSWASCRFSTYRFNSPLEMHSTHVADRTRPTASGFQFSIGDAGVELPGEFGERAREGFNSPLEMLGFLDYGYIGI